MFEFEITAPAICWNSRKYSPSWADSVVDYDHCADHQKQEQQQQLNNWGARIVQWLERRTRDPDSWPKGRGFEFCRSGGRFYFSRVNFLCWLLFQYPFHPCVTAVAHKRSRPCCQKCSWQVWAKYACTVCGFAWSNMVHGCMEYTERADMAVSCGTSHASAANTPLRWIFKNAL